MKQAERGLPGKLGPAGPKILAAGAVFLLAVLLITSFFGKKGLMEIQRMHRAYETQLGEMQKLESRKARLIREIDELRRDPRSLEREAREKLWLMKSDEIVIVEKSVSGR
jgi:cell division protein FtsB